MISRIKHLQHAKLYPFTRVANPSNRVRVSRQSVTTFIFLFILFLFFFFFAFSFPFFLEDDIGLHSWVTQTYYGSSTGLRPTLQSGKIYIALQLIGTIWCAVCDLVTGGMFRVEYAETSID